ncbi:MAG: glycoside hydrolase family 13 protein [Elusimicrobiaceae bacterium]
MKKDFVPQWAKSAVWYQIFPERFRNGDRANDPKAGSLIGAWPHDDISGWQIHPWGADWYELQPYEKANGKDLWFNIQRRRYGGDLQGVIDKLDYLRELGVNAIYLNPVFAAPSSHKYDGMTYHHIDPDFGPDPEGDRKIIAAEDPSVPARWQWTAADRLVLRLIKEAHARDMKVIFDGVFNHMGVKSWPFEDVKKNGEKSKYKDWFHITSWDNPAAGTKFAYNGWYGVPELPELRQDENGTTAGPRKYIFDCTRRWLSPGGNVSDGIDGWRLYVAFCIRHPFWKAWRKHVKAINPEAYLVAEVVDPPDVVKPYCSGDEFDAVMNYNFTFAVSEFLFGGKNRIKASEFDKLLADLRAIFPGDSALVQQNLLDSHDSARVSSRILNRNLGTGIRQWGKYYDVSKGSNPEFKTGKPGPAEIQTQKLAAAFQFTYPGAPMIYYGDEVGMWGANDPDCRKPMLWDDVKYADEARNPDQTFRAEADRVAPDKELLAFYKKLISLRNTLTPLRLGDYKTLLVDDEKAVFVFSRSYKGETVICAFNAGDGLAEIELPAVFSGPARDVLNDTGGYGGGKPVRLRLPARGAAVIAG